MAYNRIPVIVLAGFLGSGKTTMLNHLLTHSGSTRIGVIVNDFGSINIDSLSVSGQVDAMVSLNNGCLCCAVDTSGLDKMLRRLSRPSSNIDVIVIEASGLADPRSIVRMLLASEDCRIIHGGLVHVIDAAEFNTTRVQHPEIDTQLACADLVLLNKADRVDSTTLAELNESINRICQGTPVVATEHGRVEPTILFDENHRPPSQAAEQLSFDDLHTENCTGNDHPHNNYESVEFTSAQRMNPRKFMEFLRSRPDGLYRMKGIVYFGVRGHRHKFVLHTVGSFLRFYKSRWSATEARATKLIAIGSNVDTKAVIDQLGACVESELAPTTDEQSMLPVLQFTEL